MNSLTIKELVLEIVKEILSSEEDLQELFGRPRTLPKRSKRHPQQYDRHKIIKAFKPFAGIGYRQYGARYTRRGGPEINPQNPVRPPRR